MLVGWIDKIFSNNTACRLQASYITIKTATHLRTCKAAGSSQLARYKTAIGAQYRQYRLLYRTHLRFGMDTAAVIAEIRPPPPADKARLATEKLTIHTVPFCHNTPLPFPQRPIPTPVGQHNISTFRCNHLVCREPGYPAVQQRQKSSLLYCIY